MEKNHMIISTNREIIFDKIPHLFMIKKKSFRQKGRAGNLHNLIKNMYKKTTVNILVNDKRPS